MPPGARPAAMALDGAQINLQVEPLFKSIGAGRNLGAVASGQWHILSTEDSAGQSNDWDLCHRLVASGFGIAGAPAVEFAEPDLEQRWIYDHDLNHAMAAAKTCDTADDQNQNLPTGEGFYWFSDDQHSQLRNARDQVGEPAAGRILIAHCDTGYFPGHIALPKHLRTDLQRNFVDPDFPDDASDRSSGLVNNLGHGTGTLSVLAGNLVDGAMLGGAALLDVVPIRVADSVVLFKNSAIAQAFDYIHQLTSSAATRVAVISMSMGGLASQAWADAVNALYEAGVVVVTAAGNNFGNLPTHNIVYPARFNRVIAACGVMSNGKPYADLPLDVMAGNYGPARKMATAVSGCTPNTPWARWGCANIVDHDGCGTSAATPQVASAAALWIQNNKAAVDAYSAGWMRVEAVRKALFDTARLPMPNMGDHLGRGMIRALDALGVAPPTEAQLQKLKQPEDSVSFPFFRVLTGLGLAAGAPGTAQTRMLEIEAIQLTQRSHELEQLLPDPEIDPQQIPPKTRQDIIDALIAAPGASASLRDALKRHVSTIVRPQVAVPHQMSALDSERLARAINPPLHPPACRSLRVFTFDPLLGTRLETAKLNETTLQVRWENDLQPGPVGEYLEVVDVDPASGVCYAPVDLNHPYVLASDGMVPSESNPQFHQQMVYAVAMRTIKYFEDALGRVALWAPNWLAGSKRRDADTYVKRLRIYPHALREANSFYSPDKKALLFGYFPALTSDSGETLPGGVVFCCLSHDIIAHETTHALLDGVHRRFREPTNPDVLAFHEGFADIVAMFQHFTMPEALRDQIARTSGKIGEQSNMLGELAQQFGQAIGRSQALRSAIGYKEKGVWRPLEPSPTDYTRARDAGEPHGLGAVLVAAVFSAFLDIYKNRSEDLLRLATNGTGILPAGAIPHDLVGRLAEEASRSAAQVLSICIRALDYCPPVDITFGEYLRALITADRDLVADDERGYRAAFVDAFRRRGIYPQGVRNLSVGSLSWDYPETKIDLAGVLEKMSLAWDLSADRKSAFDANRKNGAILHNWIETNVSPSDAIDLGFYKTRNGSDSLTVNGIKGTLRPFEVHSVRPVHRVDPDGHPHLDVVVEITQTWMPNDGSGAKYRGGCTLIIDLRSRSIRYCIRKRVGNAARVSGQQGFQMTMNNSYIRSNYFEGIANGREPFAMIHRGA